MASSFRTSFRSSNQVSASQFSSSSALKMLNKSCVICPQAKQHCDSVPISTNKTSRNLELIHCDLWGPNPTSSSCNEIYFLKTVDDFSRVV